MSETPHASLKPLFATRPESFFGAKKEFCHIIVSKLDLSADPEEIDPEDVLRKYTKEAILRLAFEKYIGVEELIPLPFELSTEEIDGLVAQATKEGVQTFGIDGDLPPRESVAQLLLRFKAMDEVCAPVPAWSAEKTVFMRQLRSKLERFFAHD